MKCPKCNSINNVEAKFCLGCGAGLGLQCPQCQRTVPFPAKFCNECGQRLEGPKTGNTPSEAAGERKRITAIFSDISGYTAISEKLDPEEVKEITRSIFDGIREVVGKYEGFIEHFAGDGILVLFGVPMAHEDDPVRAIYVAKEIHGLVESLSPRYKPKVGRDLSMHSGISTGLAVTADVDPDRGTHSVSGTVINLAARLSDLAAPGEILVGPNAYRASKHCFDFEKLKPREVKGKTAPLQMYRVILANKAMPHFSLSRELSSKMVGRGQELDKLELQVMKVINGQGSIVNVVGEAGIGKSRLIAELKRREVVKRVAFLEGRAISIGRNFSFHPIIDILKQWAGISEADSEGAAFAKIEKAIRTVHPKKTDEILPFVATLMRMKLTGRYAERIKGIEGEALEKLILKNVQELLIRGSELRPIVIIIEDLHWADTSSLEFLDAIYRLAERHRVLFINVFRPGYLQRKNDPAAYIDPACFMEIKIEPLKKKDGEKLISHLLDMKILPPLIKEQILERAGGNPFFIEEVVHSLIDEGVLIRRGDRFEVTEGINQVMIPATINDVLIARIDRLEEETRELIKVASVIGRSFFHRLIRDVADFVEDVDERLGYLKNAQLIIERMRMQELEYLFKHALTQEAAYQSTLKEKRKALHLKVGQSIERIFRERLHEFYSMLAYHYSCCEEEEKAEEYLLKAGEEALMSSASTESIHYYEEALRIFLKRTKDGSDLHKRRMIEKNLAIALYNRGRYDESVLYFDKALALYGEKTPTNPFSIWIYFLVNALSFVINLYLPRHVSRKIPTEMDNEIINLMYKKLFALAVTDPKKMFLFGFGLFRKIRSFDVTQVKNGLAILMNESPFISWPGISFRLARKALESNKEKVKEDDVRILLHYKGAEILYVALGGDWGKEPEFDEKLVDAGAQIGEFFWASIYTYWHGYLDIERGLFQYAQDKIEKLSELANTYNNNYSRVLKYALNAAFLVKCRKYQEALAASDEGAAFGIKAGLGIWSFSILSMKARVQGYFDEPLEAEKSLSRAGLLKNEINIVPFYLCNFLVSRFSVDICGLLRSEWNHDGPEAAMVKNSAMKSGKRAVTMSQKAAPERTEAYRLMGTCYWIMGKQKRALEWWGKSLKEGERIGARLELSRTYFEVGRRLTGAQSKYKELNGVRAEEYLQRAATMFEQMALQWDLNQLEMAADGLGVPGEFSRNVDASRYSISDGAIP